MTMPWMRSHRFDPPAALLADRHYNRRKVGSPQFVPPGRCAVLILPTSDAVWVTSWPYAQYVRHAWPGAWINSLFRNESPSRASELILMAIAATRFLFGDPPPLGMITFVDSRKVPGVHRRKHRCYCDCGQRIVFGFVYDMAGFTHVGFTKAGLWAWQMTPEKMPPAAAPIGQLDLVG